MSAFYSSDRSLQEHGDCVALRSVIYIVFLLKTEGKRTLMKCCS